MTTTVRRLGPADVALYRDIRLEALRDSPEAFGDDYDEAAARPDSAFAEMLGWLMLFGAFAEGRMIGLGGLSLRSGAKCRHVADLVHMYVRPEGRGRGCAGELIAGMLADARALGVERVHLGVGATNIAAIAAYTKAGFRVYGTEPRPLKLGDRYIDEYLMACALAAAPGETHNG